MTRTTRIHPEKGDAKQRLLAAALKIIRTKGFTATSVDDLCRHAQVSKGAFFHHFKSKEDLGIAAAEYWQVETEKAFSAAPYHQLPRARDRVLGYLAFRRALIEGDPSDYSCLLGTVVQEVHQTSQSVRAACSASIEGHASTLESDIYEALTDAGQTNVCTSMSLAMHIQAVMQGSFILAKASGQAEAARDSIDHLIRYCELLLTQRQPDTGVPRHG